MSVPIYGRIPAGQGANMGNYTNTVTVTINF
jgi:spore coat protein U-like protein